MAHQAIITLTPDIIRVLRHDIEDVLSRAYSKRLVGDSVYNMEGNPRQKTKEFLVTVGSQISTRIESYHTLLEVLRDSDTDGIKDVASKLEKEVDSIKRTAKPKQRSKKAKKSQSEASSKLVHENSSTTSGFQSDLSTMQSTDTLQTPPSSNNGSTDLLAKSVPQEANSVPVEDSSDPSTKAHFYLAGNDEEVMQKPGAGEEEKIGNGIQESVQPQHAATVNETPVVQGNISDYFDMIHNSVEAQKMNAQLLITNVTGVIHDLKQRIATMESERKNLEEELKRKEEKEAELTEEIDYLKKAHADEKEADATRIRELESKNASLQEEIKHLKSSLKDKKRIADLTERLNVMEREKNDMQTQERLRLQAQVDDRDAELKAAREDRRKHSQTMEVVAGLLQELSVQRSVSSSSGISSGSNPDSGISAGSSRVEIKEEITHRRRITAEYTPPTNTNSVSTDDAVLEPPEDNDEEETKDREALSYM